jgi:hypothetical protein
VQAMSIERESPENEQIGSRHTQGTMRVHEVDTKVCGASKIHIAHKRSWRGS